MHGAQPPASSPTRTSMPPPSTNAPGASFTLTFDENPLAEFVELPEEALEGGLWFSNVLCGVLRGALEMVRHSPNYPNCNADAQPCPAIVGPDASYGNVRVRCSPGRRVDRDPRHPCKIPGGGSACRRRLDTRVSNVQYFRMESRTGSALEDLRGSQTRSNRVQTPLPFDPPRTPATARTISVGA